MRSGKGFRHDVTLFKFREVSITPAMFISALLLVALTLGAYVFDPVMGLTGGVMAGLGVTIKLKKEGLKDDNLKFMEDLEKRFEALPDNMTKAEIEAEVEKLLGEKLEKRSKTIFDTLGLNVDKLKEFLGEDDKGIRSILLKQGEELVRLKEAGTSKDKVLSIRSQIEAWRDKNKDSLARIKDGQKADLTTLQLRVASPMTPANSLSGSPSLPKPEWEAGVNELVRLQPTFWSYLRKGRSSSSVYAWVNKYNPLGAAGFIGPGVAKPGVSFELKVENSTAKKIAASLKITKELLDDIEGMQTLIETELRYQVEQKANTTLLTTGAASSTVPASIQSLSVAFTAAGLQVVNPNNWDAIRAAVAQLRAGNLVGRVVAFVNPIDKANMDMTKAVSEGQLFIPAAPGAEIVEDNNVAVGYVQVAIIDYYKILMYEDYNISYGWENDDFTKNLVTVLGEMRFHQAFNDQYTGAFIYDSFANIKAGIALV